MVNTTSTTINRETLWQLHAIELRTQSQIANELNCSKAKVNRNIKRYGFLSRSVYEHIPPQSKEEIGDRMMDIPVPFRLFKSDVRPSRPD